MGVFTLIIRLLLFCLLPFALAEDLLAKGRARDPSLPYCAKAMAAKTVEVEAPAAKMTDKDKQVFAELRMEYVKVCALTGQHKTDEAEKEFCTAFENICFKIPQGEPDQQTLPRAMMKELTPMEGTSGTSTFAEKESKQNDEKLHTHHHKPEPDSSERAPDTTRTKKKKRVDFANFCKEFKNRYLFVCPDPFRFPQKAVVFCPIYSERCHVPLPDHPIVPTRRPPRGRRTSAVDKLCRNYRGFAENYCNNPVILSQPQYREGCEKYWRFCTRRNG